MFRYLLISKLRFLCFEILFTGKMYSEDDFKKVEKLYMGENDNNSEHDVSVVSDIDDFSSNEKCSPDTLNIKCDLSLQDIQEEQVVCKFFEGPCCNKNQQNLIILSKIEPDKPSSALDKAYESKKINMGSMEMLLTPITIAYLS